MSREINEVEEKKEEQHKACKNIQLGCSKYHKSVEITKPGTIHVYLGSRRGVDSFRDF